ncbi:MAG: hypothetical protein KAR12_11610, partial [Methylococcales bacterium]|nr:hypothetical protein [Methylococcales bacterium]
YAIAYKDVGKAGICSLQYLHSTHPCILGVSRSGSLIYEQFLVLYAQIFHKIHAQLIFLGSIENKITQFLYPLLYP